MKIAIDISPLQSGHKVRGVGFYLGHLKKSLLEYYPENEYVFFNQKEKLDQKVDLVHYPYFDPFFLTLPLRKKYPTVVTVHDLTPLVFSKQFPIGIKGTIKWQLQKHNLRQADAIITDSYASKEDILQIVGVLDKKVDVAYLAAGEEFKKLEIGNWKLEILRKYNLPERFVLYVGDVTPNKNLPNLLRAIKEINVTLVMVGKALDQKHFDKDNPWNKDLLEVNKLANNDKRIIRLGFVPTEDLVALYNIATVFIMPSVYEGFGLPILEAMKSGCPVITTTGGSLQEVAGDAAYYVNPEDIYNIANGIGEVFFHPSLQKELSRKGLSRAKEFSWKKTAEETVRVYKNILSTK